MEPNQAAPGDALSQVHLHYACKLPHKAARLCILMALLRDSARGDGRVLRLARREAHQLKGTAGAYGFAAVSRCAALIEEHIEEHITDPLDDESWLLLHRLLDSLLDAAKSQCERALAAVSALS